MLAPHTTQGLCQTCGEPRMFTKPEASRPFHLVLSLVTVGLWIPVWILCAFVNNHVHPYRCTSCGEPSWELTLCGSTTPEPREIHNALLRIRRNRSSNRAVLAVLAILVLAVVVSRALTR